MNTTMKLLCGGLAASVAMALGFGIVVFHRAGDRLPATTVRASVASPAPAAAEAAEAATANDARRADTLAHDIATLREEVAHLRLEIATAGSARPADDSARALADLRRQVAALRDAPGSPTDEPVPTSEDAERTRQAQMETVEASFWHEPADQRWSAKASAAVVEALGNADTVRSLECRSQTCRVELDDSTGETAKILPIFLQQVGQTLPSVIANHADNPDGSGSTILYMARASNARDESLPPK